jgi:hypothetical protein
VERLLVLGAGAAQLGLLAAARSRGLFIIAAERDPGAPGFRYADRRAIVSPEDEPALERLAEAERIDGVIAPGEDAPIGAAARIAARLGLAHALSPETAVLSSSKLRQRERLAEAGISQPSWQVVSSPDEPVPLPCLVRPPDRPARGGRTVVRDPGELPGAVEAALRASRAGLCLVEEVVERPVVTVTAFSKDGTFHQLTASDHDPLVELWESLHAEAAVALARAATEALELRDGLSSTRIRIDPEAPKVLDVCAGLARPHEADLCRAAVGLDLNAIALSSALGEPIGERRVRPRRLAGAACVRFVRDGGVLATGASRAEALERAAWAAECIRFPAPDAQVV